MEVLREGDDVRLGSFQGTGVSILVLMEVLREGSVFASVVPLLR